MRLSTRIVIDISTGTVVERDALQYSGPLAECISFGGSKSKQKSQQSSQSGVRPNPAALDWAKQFANEATPGYAPEYTGLEPSDYGKLEEALYEGPRSKLATAYNQAVARQREELSQMGALNSPSQYLEGSARSSLDRSYIDSLQLAARDATQQRVNLEETEAARRTGFSQDVATKLLQAWLSKIGLAIEAGRYSTGQASSSGGSSGFNFGLLNFGGSQSD